MSNTLTLIDKRREVGNRIARIYKCVLADSYVASTTKGVAGETLNFQTALNPKYISRPKLPDSPAGVLPPNSDISIERIPDGYSGIIEQNAASPTAKNYILRLFTTSDTALGSAPYPAGLTDADGIIIKVVVPAKYN